MTRYPNLLPRVMLAARARRRRVRQWTGVAAAEAVLLTVACLMMRVETFDTAADMGSTLRTTGEQIDLVSQAIAGCRVELADLDRRLAITTEVDRQPDWSIVLAMVARKGAGLVRLESCQLLPGVETAEGASEYRFSILGMSSSQSEATRFVQQLEATGVFSRIKLAEARTVSDGKGGTAVRFTLETWFSEGGR